MTTKIKKLAILFMALTISLAMFTSCNNEEQSSRKEILIQNKLIGDIVPDGLYVGYYDIDKNYRIEIKESIKDNKVIKRWINDREQDLRNAPITKGRFFKDGDNDYAKNKAIDLAMELSEKYPCVSVVTFTSIENDQTIVYQVDVETDTPCEYEKYNINK